MSQLQEFYPAATLGDVLDWPTDVELPPELIRCDGAMYPCADYPELAALLGAKHGAADDGCFRVPDQAPQVTVGFDGYSAIVAKPAVVEAV